MNGHTMALIAAGVIGSGVAVVHGLLTHRFMTVSWIRLADGDAQIVPPIRRLVPALLQFSTFNWFLGGLALIAAALWLGPEARRVTGLLVGSSYLYGAIGNAWGVRGMHPGWMLYAVALGLIAYGIAGD